MSKPTVIPYQDLKVLIIEDLAEMRSSLKSMLASLGIQQITAINNGEEALRRMQFDAYDLVFSDYELGRGKDGQQVLEEIRHTHLIANTAAYILVTAAQTVDMVMGALEYEPDGYIVKPVTLDLLRTRLSRIMRTKWVYRDINLKLDAKDIEGALEACNRLALERPKFVMPAYRIKGRILMNERRYQEAKELYEMVMGIKRVAWAVLGLGKTHYLLGDLESAQLLLESLANTNSKYVEASDWLAKTLSAKGRYKAAQIVLQSAVSESPKSCLRQQALARVAELNGDTEMVIKASRKAIALGKNSVLARPEPFVSLARAIQINVKSTSMREHKIACQEAHGLIENARDQFELTPLQNLKCTLAEAETLANADNMEEGRDAYELAKVLLDTTPELTLDDRIDLFSSRLIFESSTDQEAIKASLLQEIGEDHRLKIKLYRIIENSLINDPTARLTVVKDWAKELLSNDYLEDAIELLQRAISYPNADEETRLLALESIVLRFENHREDRELKKIAGELIAKLNKLPEDNPLFPKLDTLRQRWDLLYDNGQTPSSNTSSPDNVSADGESTS